MNNMNTARAKAGIATAEYKEVVDFAERLGYVLGLKINKSYVVNIWPFHHQKNSNTSSTDNDKEGSNFCIVS
jgi:hypothetical protein